MTLFASMLAGGGLLPGFADPVGQAQQAFRAVLDAMARPGEVRQVPAPDGLPDGWSPALAALALTLFDQETPVWLDTAASGAAAYLRFHCGCPMVEEPEKAAFAVITDPETLLPIHAFGIGDPLYPERSATLVLQMEELAGGAALDRYRHQGRSFGVAKRPAASFRGAMGRQPCALSERHRCDSNRGRQRDGAAPRRLGRGGLRHVCSC